MVTEKTTYVCEDGTEFDERGEAEDYEARAEVNSAYDPLVQFDHEYLLTKGDQAVRNYVAALTRYHFSWTHIKHDVYADGE